MEECIICFEETSEFNFYRCTHKVCKQCYPRIKTCPICNTPRETVIVIESTTRVEYSTYKCIVFIGSFLLCSSVFLFSLTHGYLFFYR
jgi:hypothetical protein